MRYVLFIDNVILIGEQKVKQFKKEEKFQRSKEILRGMKKILYENRSF